MVEAEFALTEAKALDEIDNTSLVGATSATFRIERKAGMGARATQCVGHLHASERCPGSPFGTEQRYRKNAGMRATQNCGNGGWKKNRMLAET